VLWKLLSDSGRIYSTIFELHTERYIWSSHQNFWLKLMYTNIAVRCLTYHTAIGIHMPYRITQFYLPADRGDIPAFTPADARLSWPSWLVTYQDGIPAGRRSPIQVLTGPDVHRLTSFMRRTTLTTTPRRVCVGRGVVWLHCFKTHSVIRVSNRSALLVNFCLYST